MASIVIQVLKYIVLLMILMYTFSAFYVFRIEEQPEQQKKIYVSQKFLLFGIHGLGFLCLILKNPSIELAGFYLMQVALFVFVFGFYHLLYKRCSIQLLNNMFLLLAIGMVILTRLSFEKAFRQFIFLTIGTVLMLIIPLFLQKGSLFRRFSALYFLTGVALLGYVLVMASTSYGAKLTISFYGISFQPSEFVKIIYVFFLAGMLYKHAASKRVFITSALAAIFVLLLVASKDLGGALLYFMAYLVIIYAASGRKRYLAAGGAGICMAFVAGYHVFSHVQTRVSVWLNPTADIDNQGYQICQSLFAIGTGGWFGLGIGEGLPNKIPVVDKDFVFSAISEEFGAIAALCIVLLCLNCFVMIVKVALQMTDMFYKYVALGLSTLYATQVMLTIGGAIKFIPSTGVTLPLVSYGGSSLLSTLIMFGIVQGLYIRNILNEEKKLNEAEEDDTEIEENAKKKRKQKIKKVNEVVCVDNSGEIEFVKALYVVLFLAMSVYFVKFVALDADSFINNEYNKRAELFEEKVIKGSIITSDGYSIAQTEVEDGREVRVYPYGEMFSHVTGYSQKVKTGLERQANFTMLRSHAFFLEQFLCELTEEKKLGDNAITTVRYDLQEVAYEALGEYKGAVIVMEPSTGKVLTMVSNPGYDPNTIYEDWESLQDDTGLFNRATQGQYAPGSVFKMLTTLAYVESNPETYLNYKYECTGEIRVGEKTIHCAADEVHGEVNLETSFSESCNTSYANMMLHMDEEVFQKLCNYVLFNQELPVAFESSPSNFSITEEDSDALKIETAIGQGKTLVSPLHMVMLASAVANDGLVMKPYFIESVETYKGDFVSETSPQEYKTLFTETQVEILRQCMARTTKDGTASLLNSDVYEAYGKTGTAQTTSDLHKTNACFVGYAESLGKEIAIAVVVEDSGNGSAYAVPIAKKIFDLYFE